MGVVGVGDVYLQFKEELKEVLSMQGVIDSTDISKVAAQVLKDVFGGYDISFPKMTASERIERDSGIRADFDDLGLEGTKKKYDCGSSTIYRALKNRAPKKRGRRR